MSVYHDEIEIEDMEYDEETEIYYYPCPCGDRFQITKVKRPNTHALTRAWAMGPGVGGGQTKSVASHFVTRSLRHSQFVTPQLTTGNVTNKQKRLLGANKVSSHCNQPEPDTLLMLFSPIELFILCNISTSISQ